MDLELLSLVQPGNDYLPGLSPIFTLELWLSDERMEKWTFSPQNSPEVVLELEIFSEKLLLAVATLQEKVGVTFSKR